MMRGPDPAEAPPPPVGTAAVDGPARLAVTSLEVGVGTRGPAVVSDVSFTVQAGEVLGLVGESGSGKTTVALALLGHARRGLQIRSGSVLLDGTNLVALDPQRLRAIRGARVGYVPQEPSAALNPARRIGALLREALQAHGHPAAGHRVAEVVREVHLPPTPDLLRRYPHQLSGGQQQRVAIALAFCCRPSLIVLDEPTTGLDVTTQRHVLDTVRTMCRSYGVAAVYVTHDLAVLSGLASAVAVMYAGRIVELGGMRAVLGLPVHPYTRGLMAAVPSPDRAEVLTGIDGQPPRPGRRPAGCAFAPRCPHAITACRQQALEPAVVAGREVRCLRAAEIPRQHVQRPALVMREPAADSAPLLRIEGLTARYGPAPVVIVWVRQNDPGPVHRGPAPQLDRPAGLRWRSPCRPRAAAAKAGAEADPVRISEPLHLAQPAQDDRADRRPAPRALPGSLVSGAVRPGHQGYARRTPGPRLPRSLPRPAIRGRASARCNSPCSGRRARPAYLR